MNKIFTAKPYDYSVQFKLKYGDKFIVYLTCVNNAKSSNIMLFVPGSETKYVKEIELFCGNLYIIESSINCKVAFYLDKESDCTVHITNFDSDSLHIRLFYHYEETMLFLLCVKNYKLRIPKFVLVEIFNYCN